MGGVLAWPLNHRNLVWATGTQSVRLPASPRPHNAGASVFLSPQGTRWTLPSTFAQALWPPHLPTTSPLFADMASRPHLPSHLHLLELAAGQG